MSEKLIKWCDQHNIDVEDLSDELIDAFEEGKKLGICDGCGRPYLLEDLRECESCGRQLCSDCYGDIEEPYCKSCNE